MTPDTTNPPSSPPGRRWPKVLAAIAAVLVLLGVAAAFTLDRVLTSIAHEQAAALSRSWERPVEIGAVKTTFLSGLGARIEGVRIGAGAGEPRPLLELDRAEVKVALLRALSSGGKDVRVERAELQGLRVLVVKLKDGSTNVERLSEAMAKAAPAEKPAAPSPAKGEARPAELSGVRIEHAALLGGRVAFVDETAGGKELAVEAIDLVVDGLAAGAPLEVTLKAGLLSAKQNMELKVHAPPLPATLAPSPDRVTLRVEPVDLTPLAAFAPRSAGFRGGRFAADLDVTLGDAVPGGAGPTIVRGGFHATALRFAGQEGGKALDVVLDVDLKADSKQGDLSIGKLLLSFGPASLEGRGRVSGLLSSAPKIEGLQIASRNLDLASLAPYYPPLPRLLGGTVAGPIGLSVAAAGTTERPAVELRADLTPVRLALPKQVEKAAGGKLTLVARVQGGAAGALRFETEGDLGGLDLRPGGALAKRPGDRLTFALAATRAVSGGVEKLELRSLKIGLLDTNVTARGTSERAAKSTRFDLAAEIDRIDADRLLLPGEEGKKPAAKEAGARKAGDVGSPWAGLAGKATLRIGEVVAKKQRMTDLRVAVTVKEDEVKVDEGRLALWDGLLSVAGSQARLGPADRPFQLAAKIERVEVAALLAGFTDKKVLGGKLDAEVKLAGRGEETDRILKALDGTIEGRLVDGVFYGKDLIAGVTGPIADAIPALKKKVTQGGATKLGKVLPVSLRIEGGKAQLKKPLVVEERGSRLEVKGTFGLDGELAMPTTLALSPSAVSDLTDGRAKVDAPIPLTFELAGKAWSPRLAGLDVTPAVKTIGLQLGEAALGKALGLKGPPAEVKEQAKGKVEDAAKKLERDAAKKLKGLFR